MASFADRILGPERGRDTPAGEMSLNIGIGGSDLGPVMAYEVLRGPTPSAT